MMQHAAALETESIALRPLLNLRRIIVGSVGVLVALLIARLVVGAIVDRRWQHMQARLRAAGIALDITELQPAPIPDATNAAWYYKQAFAALDPKVESPRMSNYGDPELGAFPPYKPLWHELVDASETANARSFVLARQARACDQVDWGVKFASPAIAILLPSLNHARELGNVLCDGAERSIIEGDSREGIERLRDQLHLAQLVADRPFLVSGLVAVGIDVMAVDTLDKHVGALRIGETPGAVSPATIRALIADLLRDNESDSPRGLAMNAMGLEAIGQLDAGTNLRETSHMGRPAVVADMIRVSEHALALRDAAGERLNARRNQILADWPAPPSYSGSIYRTLVGVGSTPGSIRVARPLTHTVLWSVNRAFATFARCAAERDVAAIMLAIRLYQLDHDGQCPASLDALVPLYLPAIPRNKLSPDDAPYGYVLSRGGRPDGGDRPMLVRIGPAPSAMPNAAFGPATTGAIVDLTRWPPPPVPDPSATEQSTTQRVDQ